MNLRLPDKYNSPKIDEMLDSYFPGVFAGQTVEPVLVPATSTDALYSSLPPISDSGDLIFSLPSHRTLYKCQYSLEEFFLLFGVRGGVDLVHCAILEQKILFHSKDFSLLPMACECIRALLYPLSCSCVYIPVVPSTLLDLVEAPVPYILGIHSDWIQFFKPDLLADVLICDCNTGSICVGMAGPELRTLKIPKLPEKLDRWLVMGLKYALGYLNSKTLFSLDSDAEACQPGSLFDSDIQSIIQLLFIDALSSFFVGLPECLIFIDSEYPLFNKPLFLSEFTEDDDCEFVSSLTETQGFDRLISTIQTPNLTFFCMGMERRMKFCDVFRCSDCCSEEESHVTALNIRGRQYPKWVYHRVPCSILLGISERCAGEFGNIKLLVDSRLFIYGFDGNGKIKDSEVKLIQNCNSRDSDSNVDVIKRGLNVIVPNDGELDSKRSRFRTSNAKLSKKINRKSKFFDDFFGGNDGLAAVATNYDIAKTIEKNLSIKKTRRAGITFQASFDGNDVLGSGSFGHSGSFAENEKLWAMEGNGTATASLARELSPSSFRESFVGSDLVVDPPVRFSKATFQVALKNAGNWSALDVASSLNLPQEDVINAVEQKAAGKENITLRGCFVEGGARQRDAMELLTVTDVSTSMSFTQEGRSILDLLKAIHSGKVLSSFSHSKTMKLLQDSIYSLNFSTNRKRFLQILSRSERGAYGHSEGDNDLGDKTKFIQLDFEAYEVLGTLCSKFLSSCMVNKDYSSAFALLESIQYYFRIAAVVGRRKQAKLGQTYTSFTHRSIFQSNALAALQCNDFSSDESVSSIDVIDNYPENGSGDDIGNDDVTAQKFTALRLAAYELADSNRAILKDVVGLNNDFSDLSAKKSVSFVPLAPVKSVSASQRESVICLLSGHPLFQVLEFWQDIIATRLIKSNYVIPILGTQGDTQASVASDEASDASKQFALDFCVDLLNDLHSFGLPGDLGAVVVQGVALKWRLSIAEYRSLFNSICKIWNLEAQLCNIDRAYDKWKSLDLESKDKDNNESVIIVGKQSLVSDIIENLSILRAAAIDTTMPLANIGDLFINRTVIRRHTIHDIKYHSRFSTNFDAALSLDKSKIDIRDIYQLVDLSHPVSLPKNMRRYSLAGEVAKLREIEAEKFMEANFNQNKVQTKEELLSAGLANKSSDDLKNVLSFEKEISVFRSSSFESGSDQDVESGFNFGQSSSWLGKFNDVIDHEKNHIFDEVGRNEKDLQRSFSLHKSLDFFPAPEEIVTDPAQQNECCMMKDLQILTDFGAQDLTTEPAGVLIQQSPLFLSGQNATIRTLSLQCLTPEKNSTLDEEPLILHKRVASIPARISGSLLNLAFHNLPIEVGSILCFCMHLIFNIIVLIILVR